MSKAVRTDLDFNGDTRILNLPDPTLAQHAATKAYVDSAVEGLAWKDSVRVSTQANLSLASPGATIDGVTMAVNDRVLVRAQTSQPENGLYIWNGAAVPMTRAPDMSAAAEFEQAVTTVEEGTSAGSTFRQTAVNITVGTTNVLWTNFGTSAPAANETTAGIAEVATQAEADAGTADNVFITPLKLANSAFRLRKGSLNYGDGSATQFDFTHNFNTQDVVVLVRRNASPFDEVICDVEVISVNVVRVRHSVAPTSNQFRVTVIG